MSRASIPSPPLPIAGLNPDTYFLPVVCPTLRERASSPLLNQPVRTSLVGPLGLGQRRGGASCGDATVAMGTCRPLRLRSRRSSGRRSPVAGLPAAALACFGLSLQVRWEKPGYREARSRCGPRARTGLVRPKPRPLRRAAAIARDQYKPGAVPGHSRIALPGPPA